MQDGFDPYHKWLGIPPEEQPPHYYRLLAIPLFESDPEVIESAADQRMGHVRTFQSGRYSALSQQILNELAAARVCLLSREKKSSYDADLQASFAPTPPWQPPQQMLPSPPPPIEPVVSPPPVTSQDARGVAPPPAGNVLSQPSPVFPPLEGTVPDVAPPKRIRTRAATSGVPRSLSRAARTLGLVLLLIAGVVFWVLYSGEEKQDSVPPPESVPASGVPDAQSGAPSTPVMPTPDTAAPDLAGEEPTDEPALPAAASDATQDAAVAAEPQGGEGREAPTSPAEQPPAPLAESSVPKADAATAEAEAGPAVQPSLADVLKQAMPAADDSEDLAQEPDDSSADNDDTGKWRLPRPATRARVANDLRAYAKADYNTLLAEAQKPDRPSPQVYVLLEFACEKAISANDVKGVMQTIDILASKFVGSHDQERLVALNTIVRRLSERRDTRGLRTLAAEVYRASQDALGAENKPLAKSLGTLALNAARLSGQPVLIQQIEEYLQQM